MTVDEFAAHQAGVQKEFREKTSTIIDKIVAILEGLSNKICDPDRVKKSKSDGTEAKARATSGMYRQCVIDQQCERYLQWTHSGVQRRSVWRRHWPVKFIILVVC